MVFAVAALFLQFAPGALSAPLAATTRPLTRTAEATTNTTAQAPSLDASISSEPDSASSTHYNFDRVSLNIASKETSTPKLSAVSLDQHGAATFDGYSTRQSVSRGNVEDDPMLRPFAHSGAIYAAIQAGPVALDFIARRMQHSEIGMVRRMWWVPQTVSTATF